MKKEEVILINKNNRKIGTEEKIRAHKEGKLHRAFSIFIFNSKNELLIQKRAKSKYHSGGLWSNSVCGHPRPNETYSKATHKGLKEEMGFDCRLKKLFCFRYKTKLDKLIENEYDCVFIGKFDGKPNPSLKEIMDYKWISLDNLKKDVRKNPQKYTYWFKKILKKTRYFKNKRGRL